jgi:methyl-accepting chemotaxis protein
MSQGTSSDTFQTQPAGQNEQFQVVREDTTNPYVHWHYFVLSPVAVVTAVANQQLLSIAFVAVLASLAVALLGWFVGLSMARPILRAVADLRKSSIVLNTLATSQQDCASEQVWVVDSSQVGVQSAQYYANAVNMALNQLKEIIMKLSQNWRKSDPQIVDKVLAQALDTILYQAKAMEHQYNSNQQLETALKVVTQVTEQLHQGALSATQAAAQLEDVVQQLLVVAGQS